MNTCHIFYAGILLAAMSTEVLGQTYEDALRFNRNDLTGTARSQAMAGAFGSVGADLTSMAINPAGMALYRATELGLSLGVNVVKTESSTWANKAEDDRVKVPFSQMGVAFSFGLQRENTKGLVGSNFFLGYNRVADFSNNQIFRDPYSLNSLLDYFCTDEQKQAAMTGDLAYNAYLTNDTTFSNGDQLTYNVWEELVDGLLNPNFRIDEDGLGLVNLERKVEEDGSKGDFAIGYAANISQKFFIGGSLNVQSLRYEQTVTHSELFEGYTVNPNDPTSFVYRSYLKQSGAGLNFKLGFICRPVNALRVGVSITSPTFFVIDEKYHANITNDAQRKNYRTDEFEYEYKYRTPSRLVASISGILGSVGMISFDYELVNHKNSKFKEKDNDYDMNNWYDVYLSSLSSFDNLNDFMKHDALKASSTFRIGAELSVLKPFYLRGGYRMTTSPLKSDYYVKKPKDYAISGGIGFRYSNFFVDLSFVESVKKSDAWVLPDSAEGYIYEDNMPAYLTSHSHNGVVTIGFRF